MSTPDLLNDMRTTFRCPVTESRRQCALRIGNTKYPGYLFDESAGGFAVLVDRLTGLEIGQTVQLQTDSGWFNVSIRSAVEVPLPKDRKTVGLDNQTEWFRLGLQRLGDAVPLDEPSVSPFADTLHCRLRQWSPSKEWLSLSGVLLALAAMFVPLVLVGFFWYARGSGNGKAVHVNDPWASYSKWNSKSGPLPIKLLPTEELATADRSNNDFTVDRTAEPNAFGSRSEMDLHNLVRRLPGPTALGLPEVVRRLGLTEKQQELIRKIIDAMAEAMRKLDLDPLLRGADRGQLNQLRDKLFDDYLNRAVELLTPEQQAEWKKLHDESATEQ